MTKPAEEPKLTVLEEAQALVYGDREGDYGHPRDNFTAIAGLFQAYLNAKYRGKLVEDIDLTAGDTAHLLLMVKVGRYATGHPKRDTIIDEAGYVAVVARADGYDD